MEPERIDDAAPGVELPRDAASGEPDDAAFDVLAIERPHPNLLIHYFLSSLVLGPLFFVLFVPFYFRYHTLRYRFDEEGVSMRWGVLFRREIHLTYSRIQDIHLTSNLVERWLGLAKVQIQTASGSSKAEMTVEGRQDFEAIRDFLYARMRGMSDAPRRGRPAAAVPAGGGAATAAADPELAGLLREVAAELRALRGELA
ncbi:MAG TPA: PH domain-containing protein, partial [Thermoanaerobaculia bacterium]|nr:PH domain-containing protein [Thermoanaerobaculia bacterium]